MSCLVVSDSAVAIAKGLIIDVITNSNHKIIKVPTKTQHADDFIVDIVISPNSRYLAVITSLSKELLVYELPITETPPKSYALPRSASKLRYTADSTNILVADKSGDALLYDATADDDKGVKILGHLSLLLDILQTSDGKYMITSDRDEKVKVSCYPNTYNIQSYCMGHKEFVNHIELLPHDEKQLLSTSGDGTIRVWDYTNGKLHHIINTFDDVDTRQLREEFVQSMDADGILVESLPIIHFSTTKLGEVCSLLAASIHTFNKVLIYSLHSQDGQWKHTLVQTIEVQKCPAALFFYKHELYVYDDSDLLITKYKLTNDMFELETEMHVFNESNITNMKESNLDAIKMLYKRKFDNVQEYQERKRQRLEKGQ